MTRGDRWIRPIAATALVAVTLALPDRAFAQQIAADNTTAQSTPSKRSADFLFSRPHGSIGVRGSWLFASAGSDLFDFVTSRLTIDKKDFNAPGVGGYVNVGVKSNLDAQFGIEYEKSNKPSEYRDLVDNNFQAIEQTTSLRSLNLMASLRVTLVPKGRSVSRFAWVPARVIPYVGGGGGAVYYEFQQSGDFVDYTDMTVFPDTFDSSGWAPSLHAFSGVDVQVYRSLYATIEGRYTKASAKLSTDFIGFDPIDLSGFKVSAGINLLF